MVEAKINAGYSEKIINEDPELADNEKYKEYRRKWEENPKNMVVEDKPLYIAIEATNNCNLLCQFCYRTKRVKAGKYKEVGTMQMDLYKKIINEISELGVYSIKLNKDGECLMNPNIVQMVRYAKEKGILEVMFNTNAMMLNERTARGLINAGLDKILISFDSPYRERYNKLRDGADYDLVLRNVKRLKQLKDEMGSAKPIIRVNMIQMNDTTRAEMDEFDRLFKDIADVLAIQDYTDISQETEVKELVCQELWQRLIIFWDGTTVPCCGDFMADFKLGNAKTDSIKEMWNGKKLNELRNIHKSGKASTVPMCRRCSYQSL